MFLLGLLLPICFVPGYTGASIPTQWALLSLVLPLSLPHAGWVTCWHRLGIAFLAYAILSILWSINLYSAVYGLWLVAIWACAFWWGSTKQCLDPLWLGLGLGLTISTGFAVAQALGYTPVEVADPTGAFPGLLFNSTLAGASCALVIIALVTHRIWLFIPPLFLGLILSGSRGGLLILAVAAIARYTHWLAAIAFLIAGAFVFLYITDPSDSERLQIWGVTLNALPFFGHGSGSFIDVLFIAKTKNYILHPNFVHNDFLQLWYEYGIGSIPIVIILIGGLSRSADPNWPVLVGFATFCLFYFPLFAPIPAFIGCVVAGHLLRGYDPVRDYFNFRRSNLLPRSTDLEPRFDPTWGEAIPMEPRA